MIKGLLYVNETLDKWWGHLVSIHETASRLIACTDAVYHSNFLLKAHTQQIFLVLLLESLDKLLIAHKIASLLFSRQTTFEPCRSEPALIYELYSMFNV